MLLPGTADVGDLSGDHDSTVQALADLYAYPDPLPQRGWVRANFVTSLDGAITGSDGRSGSLSGAADRAVFGILRGLADVVLVGAGTVRAEKYHATKPKPEFLDRRVAAGQKPAPALAIVTRSGDLPYDTDLFDGASPTFLITTTGADLARLREIAGADNVIVAGDEAVDPADAVSVLVSLGYGRVLLEGGPRLLADSLVAGRVDELCLTWSPHLVAGYGPRVTRGPEVNLSARPAHLIAAGDVLLGRWLVRGPEAGR